MKQSLPLGLTVNLQSSSDIIRLFNIYSSILQVTCQRKVSHFLCFVPLCLAQNFILSRLCITLVAHKTIKVSKIKYTIIKSLTLKEKKKINKRINKLLTVFVISLIYFNLKSLLSNLYISISNIMDTHVLVY